MTSKPDALPPSAKERMQKITLAEAEGAEKHGRMLAEAQVEKKALINQLRKPSGISDEAASLCPMNNQMTGVEVFRFPNQLCTDKGRTINRQESGGKGPSPARRSKSINYGSNTFGPAATS